MFKRALQLAFDSALESKGIKPKEFDKALDYIRQKDASGERVTVGELGSGLGVQLPSTKLSDNQKYLLYKRHDITGGLIDLIRDAATSVEIEIRPKFQKYDINKRIRQHTLTQIKEIESFIEDPNSSDEGFFNIRKKVIVDFMVLGRAALEKNYRLNAEGEKTNRIGEIWNLPTKNIRKNPTDEAGNLPNDDAYLHVIGGTVTKKYNKDQVVFMECNPISHELYSEGQLDKLTNAILDELRLEEWNRSFIENNAMPEGILSCAGMAKKGLEGIAEYFRRHFGGETRRGRILFTDKPIDWRALTTNHSDLQFIEFLKWLMQKYIIVFHLQPFVLGLLDYNASKANAQQQVQAFKDYCIKPLLTIESFYYTQGIIKKGFGYNNIIAAFGSIDRVDSITQSHINRMDVQNSIRTINEIRADGGLMPVEWGNKPFSMLPGAATSGRPAGGGAGAPNATGYVGDFDMSPNVFDKISQLRNSLKTIMDKFSVTNIRS